MTRLTNKRWAPGTALGVAVAVSVMGAVPAIADTPADDILGALAAVTEEATLSPVDTSDVLSRVADVETTADGDFAIDERVAATDVAIPTDPRDGISLALEHVGIDIAVKLPFAEQAKPAKVEAAGIVSYDNGNGSTTVPVVKDEGSVQIATVIENSAAPTRYSYTIGLPEGGYLEPVEGGLILIRNAEGEFKGGVLPPWAKDADGQEVPTRYEIDGNVLMQIVEHDATVAYPVVADPEVGGGLLAGYWKNRPGGYTSAGTQWSTRLSVWGAAVYGQGLVGIEIVKNQGWTEWYNFPTTPVNATIEQQYKCHAQFGYAVWLAGLWWDFEAGRSSNPNWLWNPQNCNWS
jgi:hypothetical protein